MDRLRQALDFCIRHQATLGYSTVSLLTAAMEHIFSTAVFKCPCNSGNMVYGSFFLLAPAFVLLLFGYMVDARTWRQLTGICSRKKKWETCTHFCKVLVPMTARALVAPLTWISVALLGANFYECAASGNNMIELFFCNKNKTGCQLCKDNEADCPLFKIPCDEKLSANRSSERLSLQAQSQLIGWFLIVSIMTVALISKCVSRCCSSVSYPQLKLRKIYSEKETEVFETKAEEHATKLAEGNTNCFFVATDPAPFPTPSKEEWRKISLFLDSQKKYYNMMRK
ncbi:CAHM6 protein, partial [Pteruthius melanotis]|nr:CAHM6 protein [Pteruthius melanotis]